MKKYSFILLFALSVLSIFAQNNSLGSWNIIHFKGSLSKKLSYFAEAQIRSLKYYNDFHYHEFKGGITYEINGQLRASVATGKYDTYREGGDFVLPKNNDEFRLWPQLLLTQKLGKFILEQRGRVEMRFSKNGYRNRFRYRLGLNFLLEKMIKNLTPFSYLPVMRFFLQTMNPILKETDFFFRLHIDYLNYFLLKWAI